MIKEEAIKLYESKFWEGMSFRERATFQLYEDLLCMPFNIFHEAIEKTLGRSVWTHEFGLNHDGLKKELSGLFPAPTMEEILNLIPENKRIIFNWRGGQTMNPLGHKLCYCEGCHQKRWTDKKGLFVLHSTHHGRILCPWSGKAPGKQEIKRKKPTVKRRSK